MTGPIVRAIIVLACLSNVAAAQTAITVTPYGGFTSISAGFGQLGELTLPTGATGISSSSGWTAGARLGLRMTPLPWLAVSPRVGYGLATYAAAAEEPTTFSIGGVATPGRIDHAYAFSGSDISAGVHVDVQVLSRLWLTAGVDMDVPIAYEGTQDETIAEPSGVTWIDGTTTRRTADGPIPDLRPVPALTAGLLFPTTVGSFDVDLEVAYRAMTSSITTAGFLRPSFITAAIRVAIPVRTSTTRTDVLLGTALPLPDVDRSMPVIDRPLRDTLLPLVRPPAITATCRVGFRSDDGALVSTSRVTLEHHLALVLTQHEGGAVRRSVDTITIADPPSLVISPTVFTDDEIAAWNVDVTLGDTVLRIAEGMGTPPGTVTWECADLPDALLRSFVSDTVRVSFTALGRRGGAATAPPAMVRMQSTPRVRLVDTTAVRAVITGYAPNATQVPSWATSLVNELRQTADDLPTIRIIGMADGIGERSTNEIIARDRALAAAAALGARRASIGTAPLIHNVYPADRSRERGVRIDLRRAKR